MEMCVGCGDVAETQPMVGVTKEDGEFVAHPICARCHREPPRPLDMHFFAREAREIALKRAGSSTLGG